jgi:hypothetical protein
LILLHRFFHNIITKSSMRLKFKADVGINGFLINFMYDYIQYQMYTLIDPLMHTFPESWIKMWAVLFIFIFQVYIKNIKIMSLIPYAFNQNLEFSGVTFAALSKFWCFEWFSFYEKIKILFGWKNLPRFHVWN